MVAQTVKNLPAMQETQIQSLGQEDSLEKAIAIHSSILAWEIPWTEEPGGWQSMGLQSWIQLSGSVHTGSAFLKGFERRLWNVYPGPEAVREPQLSLTWKLVCVSQAPGGIWFSLLQWNKQLATSAPVLLLRFPRTGKGVEELGSSLIKNSTPLTVPAPPSLLHTFLRYGFPGSCLDSLDPAITDNLLLGGYDYWVSILLL